MKYRACGTRRLPVLNSRCCRLGSDQFGWRSARPADALMQRRMSARRPLLLPVAGYGATFSPWPPSGQPLVWLLLRRSGTAHKHKYPVFRANTASEAHRTGNRSPDRFGALVISIDGMSANAVELDVIGTSINSRNSQSRGPQRSSIDPRGNRRRALSR